MLILKVEGYSLLFWKRLNSKHEKDVVDSRRDAA